MIERISDSVKKVIAENPWKDARLQIVEGELGQNEHTWAFCRKKHEAKELAKKYKDTGFNVLCIRKIKGRSWFVPVLLGTYRGSHLSVSLPSLDASSGHETPSLTYFIASLYVLISCE